MSSSLKPITFYAHAGGPNPVKVQIVLEELGLPYEKIVIQNPKEDSFLKINPNGRLPAIIDPNNGDFTLWESGAILEYLVETYDKENNLNVTDVKQKWLLKQYLHFQMSGQGPYYGQFNWFAMFHHEKLPSAKERYEGQIFRVVEVLNTILEGKQYLLGDKVTYADLAFIPWNQGLFNPKMAGLFDKEHDMEQTYPNFTAWHQRLMARAAVKKAFGLE